MLLFLLQANNPPVAWYQDPITVATIVIACTSIGSAVISERLRRVTAEYVRATQEMLRATQATMQATKDNLQITKDIFEASHRPYIGVFKINTEFRHEPPLFAVEVHYKNVGSVPASGVNSFLVFKLDNIEIPIETFDDGASSVMIPNQEQVARYWWPGSYLLEQVTNRRRLTVAFSCTYKGVTEQEYRYEQESVFNIDYGRFYVIRATAT